MIKRSKRKQDKKFYRVNERIFAQSIRVLDKDGKQIGVMSKNDALDKAKKQGLDLVEVAPTASPPVAKIIDFKKFLYQEEKKRREERKKTKVSETKEVRLGPFMDGHDLTVSIKKSKEFLESGNKVKLVLKFPGRSITHPEFGERVLEKVINDLSGISKVEREKHFEGRQLIAILSPEKHAKEKNTQINSKKV